MNFNSRKNALFLAAALLVLSGSAPCSMAYAAPEVSVMQQSKEISGTVLDPDGQPVVGAYVIQKGTTNGTITDLDGKFTLKGVEAGMELEFSFVGFESVSAVASPGMSVTMQELVLEDVVVVGYGVQKKKLVTGATVQVKGEEIAKMNTSNALTAMQASTPGVQITQASSQPGKGFKVNIRGVGTIGTSSPLLIIDGVNSGTANDGLNGLNPNDIESIDVLKDAASAAIYGARAANGVILVTTKQGKAGKIVAQYDGFMGISNAYKRPATLGAHDYMRVVEETHFNSGLGKLDWSTVLPQSTIDKIEAGWDGEDWWSLYENENAFQQSHAFSITGGTDRSKFAIALNYSDQEGIMGGDNASTFKRYGGRINSDHVLLKSDADGRDIIKIGENLSYWYQKRHEIAEGNGYWSAVQPTLSASPLVPAYNEDGSLNEYTPNNGYENNLFSNPWANFLAGGYNGINRYRNFGVGATFFLEVEPIKGLKYRGQVNTGYSAYANKDNVTLPYSSSAFDSSSSYGVAQSAGASSSMTVENTLSYTLPEIAGNHFDLLVGQSIEKSLWSGDVSANASASSENLNSLILKGYNYTLISNYDFSQVTGANGYASEGQGSIASVFGRLNWNLNETYMATVTVRGDGSNNFAKGNRWGFFPSASAGWVLTNESFLENAHEVMDFLKIRASWGQNGNCNIGNFYYVSNIGFSPSGYADYGYKFGSDNATSVGLNQYSTGAYSRNQPNPDVTWETSEQLNIGLDARFLNSRLGLNFDWYKKTTKDWLVQAPTQDVFGYEEPAYINGGDVENTGLEVALTWNDSFGDFNYHANVNFATNKNEVTRLATASGKIGDGVSSALFQNSSYVALVEKGQPIGYFSGMSYSGIWQNQAQIDAARANGKAVLDNAQPGDCIWDDYNNDGTIEYESDRHMIGDPNPDLTLGVTLGFDWKGLDFSVSGSGAFGQQVMMCYRTALLGHAYNNYTTDVFDRWHGEGTSNTMPRLVIGTENNQWVSTKYMQDADYFKIQNVTLGYDFKKVWKSSPFGQLRLYVQAQNIACFTSYTGLDPEVGSNGGGGNASWVKGIDQGQYPMARTYLAGVNIKF